MVKEALNQWDDAFITKQLENERLKIENTIKAEQEKLLKIELAKGLHWICG